MLHVFIETFSAFNVFPSSAPLPI